MIEENKDVVIAHWLQQVMANDDLRRVELSDADRIDHVPGLLDEAITHARDGFVSLQRQKAADQHSTLRYHQRYTVPMLILEARLLQDVVFECIRQNFLVIDLSNLVADITKMSARCRWNWSSPSVLLRSTWDGDHVDHSLQNSSPRSLPRKFAVNTLCALLTIRETTPGLN